MRAIGIILASGTNKQMKELVNKRAMAAMPVGGSFRAIDFTLSSMHNSNIKKVAVLTQYNSYSLNEHLSSSKWWDFGRKQGGLFVFNPMITADNSNWYRGSADALFQNINFLKSSHEPYVIIASGNNVYKMDFHKLLEYHIAKKAEITIVCKDAENIDKVSNYGMIKTDGDGKITEFEEKPMASESNLISCGIYVIRRRLLIEMLEKCADEDRYDFVNDIIIRYKNMKRFYAYNIESYWASINCVEAYYRINMDFLNSEIQNYFFKEYPHIFSKVEDNPPAKYNQGSNVSNSLISSGCIINGTVENSVLFGNVFIGNNCRIRNSIILNNSYIGNDTVIENCIVESRCTIKTGMTYLGKEDDIQIVIEENDRYTL